MREKLIAVLIMAAGPVSAIEMETVDACLSGGGGGTCVHEALAECGATPSEAPALAALCYREAQNVFGDALAERLAAFETQANEVQTAVVRTETKYDMLSGFIQCDRAEELSIVATDIAGAVIAREKAVCMATITGLVYDRTRQRLGALGAAPASE